MKVQEEAVLPYMIRDNLETITKKSKSCNLKNIITKVVN